jgi:hypothetical protein
MIRRAVAAAAALFAAAAVQAETVRIATFNVELTREGPGLLLRDIEDGTDPQVQAVIDVIARIQPDILALQGIDYDFGLQALSALSARLGAAGVPYSTLFARPTNRGEQTGLDLDGNGRVGEAADAQGFGRFYGQGAMALLSRYPIDLDGIQDFTTVRWADMPDTRMPMTLEGLPFPSVEAASVQRLSSSGHWIVPVWIGGTRLSLMTFHASPPVFDGPEDRNGLRNADEIRVWQQVLDGRLGTAPDGAFVIAGAATLDPFDSDGRHDAIRDLLSDPRVQDPVPTSAGAAQAGDQGHLGENARDTVDWPGVGRLRVDYVLPSAGLSVVDAGVFWPEAGAPGHQAARAASRHRLVWVDVTIPD